MTPYMFVISERESPIIMASKTDMTPEEREAKEQEEFSTGPLRWTNFDTILIYTNKFIQARSIRHVGCSMLIFL